MSDWEHVDKEEIIISEDGLDEAMHNAYLKGRNDVLDKIRAEIEQLSSELTSDGRRMIRRGNVFHVIDKYRKGEEECR